MIFSFSDQPILNALERENVLTFTPSRQIQGKRLACYDDRYILNLAAETNAVIVSNDHYRDLVEEKAVYKKLLEEKVLMFSFVNDRLVFIHTISSF